MSLGRVGARRGGTLFFYFIFFKSKHKANNPEVYRTNRGERREKKRDRRGGGVARDSDRERERERGGGEGDSDR